MNATYKKFICIPYAQYKKEIEPLRKSSDTQEKCSIAPTSQTVSDTGISNGVNDSNDTTHTIPTRQRPITPQPHPQVSNQVTNGVILQPPPRSSTPTPTQPTQPTERVDVVVDEQKQNGGNIVSHNALVSEPNIARLQATQGDSDKLNDGKLNEKTLAKVKIPPLTKEGGKSKRSNDKDQEDLRWSKRKRESKTDSDYIYWLTG